MIKLTAYQLLMTHFLNDAMLSSDNSNFRNVANGPEGSTSLHRWNTSQYPLYSLHGVPGFEYMSGTSYGALFHSNELLHSWFSPGFLQHNSHDFVFGSFSPGIHWHDSNPYARQIEPVHSWKKNRLWQIQWMQIWSANVISFWRTCGIPWFRWGHFEIVEIFLLPLNILDALHLYNIYYTKKFDLLTPKWPQQLHAHNSIPIPNNPIQLIDE